MANMFSTMNINIIVHSYDFTTMAEDCLGKIYFKVRVFWIFLSLAKNEKDILDIDIKGRDITR